MKWILNLFGFKTWMLIAAAFCFATGWQVQSWRYEAKLTSLENRAWDAELRRQQHVVRAYRLADEVKNLVSENRALAAQKQKTVTEYVNREVIKYVQSPDAGKCQFNDDWVRIYDSAAGMSQADTTPRADAAAARITDIEVLENATGNYATCHDIRQDLISLQEWVRLNSGL